MKRLIVVGAIALFPAACSSAASTAPTIAPPVTTTSIAYTVATTSTPSTTSPSTTTSTTTTVPAATTTTTPPTEVLIKQAVQEYAVAFHACGAAPAACVPEGFTATQGHSRSTLVGLATGMAAQGLYFSTDLRGSYLVAESVAVASPTEAIATFCAYDAGAVMGPIGPDGVPTIVDDQILTYRIDYHVFLEAGSWKVGEQVPLQTLGKGNLCPPAE